MNIKNRLLFKIRKLIKSVEIAIFIQKYLLTSFNVNFYNYL